MNRRRFAQFVAAALLASSSMRAAKVDSRVRFSFMLWALERQAAFDRCVEMVAEAGYQGVELVGEFQTWTPEERRRKMARMRSLGMVFDAMSGVKAGFAVPQDADAFLAQLQAHLSAANELECRQVILLSGNRVEGLAADRQRAVSVENLKRAAEMAAKESIEIVIEPIDLLENPAIFLASVSEAFTIAEAVNAPHVKVLYDLYHEQRSFGNLLEKLEQNIARIGLIHVADVPGRHEPGTGEIAYAAIYRKLAELHYERWIAMEFYPAAEPVATLKKARLDAQAAMKLG